MDFDCWTGIKIGEKSYIIAEKIRYKEKTSDDVWTEYGLITSKSNDRIWLTIADGGLSCSLSHPVARVSPPQGYRLHDKGMELVTGVWGDTDAAVGDTRVQTARRCSSTRTGRAQRAAPAGRRLLRPTSFPTMHRLPNATG